MKYNQRSGLLQSRLYLHTFAFNGMMWLFREEALGDYKHTRGLRKSVITEGVAVLVCFNRSVR